MENQYTTPPQPLQTSPIPPMDIPERPKTWLVESILITILCCLPFGIVGIVNAAKVNSLYDQTLYDEAKRASASAKKWAIIGLVVGLIVSLVYLAFIIRMAMTGDLSEMGLPGAEGFSF